MLNYILGNDNLRLYFGNKEFMDINYRNQNSYELYDNFKVSLCQREHNHNEIEIHFAEGLSFYFDGYNLHIKRENDNNINDVNNVNDNNGNNEYRMYNTKYDVLIKMFDEITSNLNKNK